MWKLNQESLEPDLGEREQQMANLKECVGVRIELKTGASEIRGGEVWKWSELLVHLEQTGVDSIVFRPLSSYSCSFTH